MGTVTFSLAHDTPPRWVLDHAIVRQPFSLAWCVWFAPSPWQEMELNEDERP